MTKGLRIRDEEIQSEDLDPRTQGDLLHQIHHDLICDILSMEERKERDISEVLEGEAPVNLSTSEIPPEELIREPWKFGQTSTMVGKSRRSFYLQA